MQLKNVKMTQIAKAAVEKFVRVDANSTTCIAVYQPKAPKSLKKYSKIENDK